MSESEAAPYHRLPRENLRRSEQARAERTRSDHKSMSNAELVAASNKLVEELGAEQARSGQRKINEEISRRFSKKDVVKGQAEPDPLLKAVAEKFAGPKKDNLKTASETKVSHI